MSLVGVEAELGDVSASSDPSTCIRPRKVTRALVALASAALGCGATEPRTVPVSSERADAWARDVEPVFRRACTPCHLPGDVTDIDLTSAGRWEAMRAKIHRRVIEERTMPPERELPAADRAVLRDWLER